jgi:surface protein
MLSAKEDMPILFYEDNTIGTCSNPKMSHDPKHGKIAQGENKNYYYIPDYNFHGTEYLKFKICNSQTCTREITYAIDVESVNDVPVVYNRNYRLEPNQSVQIEYAGAFDPDGADDALEYAIETQPQHGTIHDFVYTPDQDFVGLDSVRFSVTDGEGGVGYGTFYFNVGIQAPWITRWKVDNRLQPYAQKISISCTDDYAYNYTVDWGDGDVSKHLRGNTAHTYTKAGIYTAKISGEYPHIRLGVNNSMIEHFIKGFADLLFVEQWGDEKWQSMARAFSEHKYLHITATDAPNLSEAESTAGMFKNALHFNSPIEYWDMSHINNISIMFENTSFNQPLNDWNVSQVISMDSTFNCTPFNQPIDKWDTSSVQTMGRMFASTPFNHTLNSWDTSHVTDMRFMFASSEFDGTIGDWDVSSVEDMTAMFAKTCFNQPLGRWNTSYVTKMEGMFGSNKCFDQPIDNWDTSSVIDMHEMFYGASNFNQPIGSWDVGNVMNMDRMFANATSFDQDISLWRIVSVRKYSNQIGGYGGMRKMFYNASLSSTNYDAILEQWSKLPLNKEVELDAGHSKYSIKSQGSRKKMIQMYGWKISDGGLK